MSLVKKRSTLMAYGIGLIFDQRTESHIREVWDRLAGQGLATPLRRAGCLPHVSLILSERLQVDALVRDLEALRPDVPRVELCLSHVGVFTEPEIVLFYGVAPTEPLLRLRADVERIYRRWGAAILPHMHSGLWVPHCTLAERVAAGRLSDAIAAAATLGLPWAAAEVRLAVVRFDRVCVERLHLCPGAEDPGCSGLSPARRAGAP
jgi:2'-5' RNA ligase